MDRQQVRMGCTLGGGKVVNDKAGHAPSWCSEEASVSLFLVRKKDLACSVMTMSASGVMCLSDFSMS